MIDKHAFADDVSDLRQSLLTPVAPARPATSGMARGGEIRPLVKRDIPGLATIYHRVFLKPGTTPPAALGAHLERQFLTSDSTDIGSLVYERGGTITGFVGSMPMDFSIEGRTVRAAILTSFMVDNHADDPMAGARLLRAMVGGPQDITLSETASQTSVAMWRSLRGSVLPSYSLDWLKLLSPARYLTARVGQRAPAIRLVHPAAKALDAMIARRPIDLVGWMPLPPAAETGEFISRNVGVDEAAAVIRGLSASYTARPLWPGDLLERRLAAAWVKSRLGPVVCRTVLGRGTEPIGLFIYHAQPAGIGHVLQILARPGRAGAVLDHMFRHATGTGITALRGRADPVLLDALLGRGCSLTNVSTTVAMARDRSLLAPLLAGTALVTGLAGETWSPLNGNDLTS